jgi:hypothetical protein
MDERKAGIRQIEPFGIFGGVYEVDAAGLRLYRLAWATSIVTIVAAASVIPYFELPWPVRYSIYAVGLGISLVLCRLIVKNGTRIPRP